MSDIRWQRIWDIFFDALEVPVDQRDAFLDQRCGSDKKLRDEVSELLAAHEDSTNPIEGAGWALSENIFNVGPQVGDDIDGYQLIRLLGEGGMGLVYEAQQTEPIERFVALKLVKAGMDTRDVIRRFGTERQSLAVMNHPGIAQVFDAGVSQQGRPYFVMELVNGQPINRFCDQKRLTIEQRIDLFREVCRAIQHAHQKGVIHRDLKPSNVLVAMEDGEAHPKIIDFGIARALHRSQDEAEGLTHLNQVIGTPEYMSPEQARVNSVDIDTRTDIYSLGVMLYELLVGVTPYETEAFRRGDYYEIQRILREEEPPPPSARLQKLGENIMEVSARRKLDTKELQKKLSGDLDWIVLKALEKDRTKRYDTVAEFNADLERFIQKRPVSAHPPLARYRLKKFIARHKFAVVAASATIIAFLVAIVGITVGLVFANRERHRAETVSKFLEDMLLASQPENARGQDTTYLQGVLAQASRRVDKELKDQPEAAASLHFTIALTYRSLGLYDEASKHMESSLNLRRKHLGENHELTVKTMSELSTMRWEEGDYKTAENLARRALDVQNRIYKPDEENRLYTLNTLGLVLKSTGRIEEAEKIYREVAETRRGKFGVEHLSTLTSISNLARLLEEEGRIDEAAKLMTEVVDVGRRLQGSDDPHTLVSIDILGVMKRKQGKLQEAEALHKEALAGCKRVLGDQHVDTLGVRRNLAMLLMEQGKLIEAESELRGSLDEIVKEYGEQTFYTLSISHALADCLLKQNKVKEAEALYERARKIGEAILPPEHALLALIRSKQGGVLVKLNEYGKAESLLLQSYPILEKTKGPQDPSTISARKNLIELYERTNRTSEAVKYRK
jgi:serine/threonine protein kinase/tetratricopeptide (TPR) repeat protein